MKYPVSILLLIGLAVTTGSAQTYDEPGLVGSSGIVLLPTAALPVRSHFRVTAGRIDFVRPGYKGLNTFGLSAGFSFNLEGYVQYMSEQNPAATSAPFVLTGGKFLIPFVIPVVERLSVWYETQRGEYRSSYAQFLSDLDRGGLTTSFGSDVFRGAVAGGVTIADGAVRPLAGAGVTLVLDRSVKIGAEGMYGYAGRSGGHVMLSAAVRVAPFVCIQASPGYVSMNGFHSWTLSAGISVGTADIDFLPVVEKTEDEFQLPTIEELEQQKQGEKQEQ